MITIDFVQHDVKKPAQAGFFILENPAVHEKHEKIQMHATIGSITRWVGLPSLSTQLIYFVTFVLFVDEKRF